jgi:transglutaminase-like putative cysteine protease
VQSICDFVHHHIAFGYEHARVTRMASEAYQEGRGVCRDYAHLAVVLPRLEHSSALLHPLPRRRRHAATFSAGGFAAWFEAYLGGRWYTFEARNNEPRIGRVLLPRGRDASDVAITTTFGPNTLTGFRVWTDEIVEGRA